LLWFGFTFHLALSEYRSEGLSFFLLWSGAFALIGVYLVIGRFFADAWIRGRTHYGVTDERAVIVQRIFSTRIRSVQLRLAPEMSVDERSGGMGTITFGPGGFGRLWVGSTYWERTQYYTPPAFEFIPDVRQVYEIIKKAQSETERRN
jgi:hypothetical protein